MKKFFLFALLVASAGFGLESCSNGDYDANPNTNNSNVGNPLNPGGSGGLSTGTIKAKLNGTEAVFDKSGGYVILSTTSSIGAFRGTVPGPEYDGLSLLIDGFDGVKTYTDGEQFPIGATILYNKIKNENPTDIWNNTIATGRATIKVAKYENNNIQGTFEGVIYYTGPGSANPNDSIVVTDGQFNVNKR